MTTCHLSAKTAHRCKVLGYALVYVGNALIVLVSLMLGLLLYLNRAPEGLVAVCFVAAAYAGFCFLATSPGDVDKDGILAQGHLMLAAGATLLVIGSSIAALFFGAPGWLAVMGLVLLFLGTFEYVSLVLSVQEVYSRGVSGLRV